MVATRLVRLCLAATLLAAAVFSASCARKKAPVAVVPPPPDYFQIAEKYFADGDYANAVQAYNTYLTQYPEAPNRDQVLFRMAVAYAFPQSSLHNTPRATQLLQQVARMPASSYKPQAQLLLSLLESADRLRLDVSKRDERIKDLTRELERLKQIDMQRHPIRPPR